MDFSLWPIAIFTLMGILGTAENEVEGATVVHEAKLGETVVLPCPSDDKLHRFQYWLLKNEDIIGPWNNREENRVRYEVWSGRLIIKKVSGKESGQYRCFSKSIIGSEVKAETVELLVLDDWKNSFENDTKVNIYRAAISIIVLSTVITIAIIVFCKRRRRSFRAFGDYREESPDLSDRSVNNEVYRTTSVSLKKPTNDVKLEKPLETAFVETDISTSFSLNTL